MKRNSVLLTVLAFVASNVYAYDFEAVCPTGQTLYYNIIDANNHYVEVTRPLGGYNWNDYSQPTVSLVIPSNVTHESIDYSVVSIADRAFFQCSRITDVALSNTIQYLGERAFYRCTGLSSITIPSSVTTINEGVFQECSHINTLYYNAINSSFIFSGSAPFPTPFYGCTSLHNLIIGPNVHSIPDYLFYIGDYNGTLTGPLVLPSSLISIGDYAFCGCRNINGILSIPDGVTYVGHSAFCYCGITSIVFNATNCQCPGSPFGHSEYIPSNVETISIGSNVQVIPDFFFDGLSGITELTIPNSVTTIGRCAFNGCSGITNLQIPSSVHTIGEFAFFGCDGLVSVELGPNLSLLQGGGGFSGLNLQNLTYNCTNCQVNDPNAQVFFNCNIDNLQIGNNVQSIPDGFLQSCSINSPISLPESLIHIGEHAFYDCQFVGTLTIPQHVTTIGGYSFAFMRGISKVTSLAPSTPTCTATTFKQSYGVSNPPLEVPCGRIHDYSIVLGWSNFQNISESTSCTHQISVYVNPSDDAGVVQGAGTYNYGSNCTLKAIPNPGYVFVKWTHGGTQVSTNPTYSFTVTSNLNLAANFDIYDEADEFEESISIYPNPSNNKISIKCRGLQDIEIYNTIGLMVLMKKTTGNHNEIDIQQLPQGLYHIKLQTNCDNYYRSFVKL